MSNRTDIVVETDNAEGQVLLSASRVYDLTEDKTQDTINSEVKNTLNQLESDIAVVVDGKSCALGASQGQYIILKNSTISGLYDGLYTAAQPIPAGEQNVTLSMLTGPISGGGLNSLKNTMLFNDVTLTPVSNSNYTVNVMKATANRSLLIITFDIVCVTATGATTIRTLPSGCTPKFDCTFTTTFYSGSGQLFMAVKTNGEIRVWGGTTGSSYVNTICVPLQ